MSLVDDFTCLRCGRCCRLKVRLSLEDIARIRSAGFDDFFVVEDENFYLKRPYGYCIFLKYKDGQFSCAIHDIKPEGCKQFPFVVKEGEILFDPRCRAFSIPKVSFKSDLKF
ncbi:MAG TPA: YkgJ family cysteine cluster protein [Candidatus Woesearchaeota archaeon]|nr:YkgJ family cysteine cluster protein [Candidatus Woesearchaeota archaeon]